MPTETISEWQARHAAELRAAARTDLNVSALLEREAVVELLSGFERLEREITRYLEFVTIARDPA